MPISGEQRLGHGIESIDIRRGIEDVWGFVSDLRNDVAWCPKVKAVDPVGPRRWRVIHGPAPLRPAAVLLVEELAAEPPSRLKLHEDDAAAVFEVEYQPQQTPQGTRLTQISVFSWKKPPPFLHAICAYGVYTRRPTGTGTPPKQGSPPAKGSSGQSKRQLTTLALAPAAFIAAKSGPSASAKRSKTGTTIVFKLTKPATVMFKIELQQAGKKVHGKSVAGSKAEHAARCTRLQALAGSFR